MPVAPRIPSALEQAELPRDDLKDDGLYVSLEYSNLELANRNAISVEIDRCRYSKVSFRQASLDRVLVSDSRFDGCDLANARAVDSSLLRVALTACRMTGLSWISGGVRETEFTNCRMSMTSFRFSTFKNTLFADCLIENADFQAADLRGARFERCNLTGVQLSNAQMQGTQFADCILTGINGVTSLQGAIMRSTDIIDLAYVFAGALGIKIEDEYDNIRLKAYPL